LSLPHEEDLSMMAPWEIRERLEHVVDLVIEVEHCEAGATTVIDLTSETPVLVREGLGDLSPFSF